MLSTFNNPAPATGKMACAVAAFGPKALGASNVIKLDDRVRLVGLEVVEAMRGCHIDKISKELESGSYLWTWDFSMRTNGRRRELRFWIGELPNPKAVAECSLEGVIAEILPPTRTVFPCGDLTVRFAMSRQMLMNFRRALGVKATGAIYRGPLVEFLRRRWLGAQGGMRGK